MKRVRTINRKQLIGLAVALLGVLLLYVALTGHTPLNGGSGGTRLTARFADAVNVDDSTPVRVGGVDVGRVMSLAPAPANTTRVAMSLTQRGLLVHQDAHAVIRWRTLLGGSMYIDLRPGSASAPPLRGEIPLSQTSGQVDWDQLNSQMPGPTRPQFRRQFKGFDQALSAPAQEGNTIRVLGPAFAVIGSGSQALRGQQIGDLTHVVRSSAATLDAIGSDTASLQRLVDGADVTLGVTAAHNQNLAAAIQLSPPALASTRSSAVVLDQTLTALDPLVARLQPGARLLGPATTALKPLLGQTDRTLGNAVPLLQAAPGTLQSLGSASRQGVPLIRGLTPVVSRLNRRLLPFLATTDPDTRLKLYETFGPMASALSSSLSGYDSNGFVYNFDVQLSGGSTILPCDTGPGGTSHLVSCITQAPSYLPKTAGAKRR